MTAVTWFSKSNDKPREEGRYKSPLCAETVYFSAVYSLSPHSKITNSCNILLLINCKSLPNHINPFFLFNINHYHDFRCSISCNRTIYHDHCNGSRIFSFYKIRKCQWTLNYAFFNLLNQLHVKILKIYWYILLKSYIFSHFGNKMLIFFTVWGEKT